ncbi:MAG: hypothetical protein ACLFTT_00165 [Candidatus Hydrogenedentota bacterium]
MLGSALLVCATLLTAPDAYFQEAEPVWVEGRETEKNLSVRFRAAVSLPEEQPATLRIAASTLYRAYVNGAFAGHGPARAAHGHYRLDEWNLAEALAPGPNVVAIEVAGYNVNSYYLLDQPAFLQAEVVSGGEVLAATGGAAGTAFEASILDERVQKVQRFSFQRPFIEVYDLAPGWDTWRTAPEADFPPAPLAKQAAKTLIPRNMPYAEFMIMPAQAQVARGTMGPVEGDVKLWKDRALVNIGPDLGGYPEDELDLVPSNILQHMETKSRHALGKPFHKDQLIAIEENDYHIIDLGRNLSGFPRFTIRCTEPVRLYVTWDEILMEGDVNWRRLGCVNILTCDFAPGTYEVETFEPYTMRYLKFIAAQGACAVADIGMRRYENPATHKARFAASDPQLGDIFEAAVHTYAQNAADLFMDCPHRERAGWLCDSYFIANAALHISGNTVMERAFLENYAQAADFAYLPDGMLPMCYPADHYNGVFIPNWALWFVVQLGPYSERSGDEELIERLKPKVCALFDYLEPFENEDGLLEKLDSWVFVEWSKANEFVQDVNYPSNMLYAKALATAAKLYDMPALAAKARKTLDTVREQSFDGEFFVDNAVRKEDGSLEVTQNHSEVCQYFAFYMGAATAKEHGQLQQTLIDAFGPDRIEKGLHPDVHPANMFIGHMLRLELLSQWGEYEKILETLKGNFHHMAVETGTLWENDGDYASLNHGFASHAAVSLYRDVLGVQINRAAKQVNVRAPAIPVAWCEGALPVEGGEVFVRWERDAGAVDVTIEAPAGFTYCAQAADGIEIGAVKTNIAAAL